MSDAEIRLALVQLAHRFDHSAEEVVERARKLEGYVLQSADKPRGPAREPRATNGPA